MGSRSPAADELSEGSMFTLDVFCIPQVLQFEKIFSVFCLEGDFGSVIEVAFGVP
jgi:hypothetical protein